MQDRKRSPRPETVRPCILALEAGRRETTGPETVIVKPETAFLSSDSEIQNRTVYAVGERLVVLKHVTEKYGIDLGRTANMLQFGRRNTNGEATAMLQAIRRERPRLLWVQWHPDAREPSRRAQIRTAVKFLSGLA